MSFILQNLGKVSASANADAPAVYSYTHPTDIYLLPISCTVLKSQAQHRSINHRNNDIRRIEVSVLLLTFLPKKA